MNHVGILVEYEGTHYYGWQSQTIGNSVQQEIEKALELAYGTRIVVFGSGRTDAGVHARGQVFHINVPEGASSIPVDKIAIALNTRLAKAIRIRKAHEVEPSFHARYSAQSREYVYRIAKHHSVFDRHFSWTPDLPYDSGLFSQCIRIFGGQHDFTSISKHNPSIDSYVCNVEHCNIEENNDGIVVRIRADRFVYGMCRSIVGMAMFAARAKISIEEVCSILDSGKRSGIAPLAPARGLVLNRVRYPNGIFDNESYF